MDLHTWWLYVGMTFVVSATPGPNMLLVMRTSAQHGWRRAVATMAGCMSALMAMMGLSALGLGALLLAFPAVFDTLRLLGAAYLAYLGWSAWRAPLAAAPTPSAPTPADPAPAAHLPLGRATADHRLWALYRQGVLVAASNPKAILFAAAFLPQFIRADRPQWPQFLVLLATFSVIEVGWYLVYAFSGQRLARHLRQPSVLRAFNRITGGAFMGFAAMMALVQR